MQRYKNILQTTLGWTKESKETQKVNSSALKTRNLKNENYISIYNICAKVHLMKPRFIRK